MPSVSGGQSIGEVLSGKTGRGRRKEVESFRETPCQGMDGYSEEDVGLGLDGRSMARWRSDVCRATLERRSVQSFWSVHARPRQPFFRSQLRGTLRAETFQELS